MSKEEIQFDPVEYEYMDDMPLVGWIWEFKRRNEQYRALYHEIVTAVGAYMSTNSYLPILREMEGYHNKLAKSVLGGAAYPDYESNPKEHNNIFVYAVSSAMRKSDDVVLKYYSYDPYINYDKADIKPVIDGVSSKLIGLATYDELTHREIALKSSKGNASFDDTISMISPGEKQDTIYLGIDKSCSMAEIKQELDIILKPLLVPSKARARTSKWKYYLIVRDILVQTPSASIKDISDALSAAYPENGDLFDERNIESYNKNALALINGGYRKYCYSTK